ncbi:odorant receptor 45b-like [Phymastichus coffea]|uniref:odorant receptor 45b-like n=1 Tax=Phymastichus coffea TaxID=108790 RepID=UPI00273B8BDB|nr:odorant receptor 45b-like [Phymastichus coffea]
MIKHTDGTLTEALFVVGFTYLSSNLFICCYVAKQLRTESLAVELAMYESAWYNMKTKESQLLLNILLRSKRPFEITARKFFIFSLDTFSLSMKTSASYVCIDNDEK